MARITLILIFLSNICVAQYKSETIYYAWIKKLDRSITEKGYLIELKENHVVFAPKAKYSLTVNGVQYQSISYAVTNIEILQIRKSNKLGNGIWKGALWGGCTLGIIALAGNDGWFSSPGAFAIGFIGGIIPGAIIGTGIGAKKMKFYINGEKTSYQKQKEELSRFLLN